ncbi:sigma-54 interaction domain-containing protein [Isachenkonia alkalipeptolytica]|uniref:PAS domain-containing protein n=1 Tax=Isachenkonia alkalipeptolytica TaxID=2565777 RepID=A0AA43XLP0_9CLOT|nr:PAS domain-containing protein [Isachenkonia alkalipeptolytica]
MENYFARDTVDTILNNIDEGVQIIDSRGKILYSNDVALVMEDIDQEEVTGKHILSVYPSLTDKTSTLLQVLRTGEPMYDVKQEFLNFKGNKITTINTSIPIIEEGHVMGAIEISRDITKVRALSEQLVDLQKELYYEEPDNLEEKRGTARYTVKDIIGSTKEIVELKRKAIKAAENDSSVIVYGNTGTGKELIVQAIHNASKRRDEPFVAQNCAAIPGSLLESILFGTVKGSFTDADNRPGLFELANKGTLFLDEINSMPFELQAKLLRVLEEGRIRRVGDIKTRKVDVRIIAAMNMDPYHAMKERKIRDDLFYRLSVVSFRVPNLVERKEDIKGLVQFFIRKFNRQLGKNVKGVTHGVLQTFYRYHWPGNIRELENILEGAMNMIEGTYITEEDLPRHLTLFGAEGQRKDHLNFSLKKSMENWEKQFIEDALKETGGNVTKAAQLLKIPRQTLQYKVKKLGITAE